MPLSQLSLLWLALYCGQPNANTGGTLDMRKVSLCNSFDRPTVRRDGLAQLTQIAKLQQQYTKKTGNRVGKYAYRDSGRNPKVHVKIHD